MDIILKILILGDSNVGKTSLLLDYVDNYFPDSHVATIGIDFKMKSFNYNGLNIKLQLWDTSGQERFRSLTQRILKDANGIAFVYDLTSKKSFDGVKSWLKDVEDNGPHLEKILIGNKCDLEGKREVAKEKAEKLATKKDIPLFDTSAKLNMRVTEAFDSLVKLILKNKTKEEIIDIFGERPGSFSISSKRSKSKEKKKKCCYK